MMSYIERRLSMPNNSIKWSSPIPGSKTSRDRDQVQSTHFYLLATLPGLRTSNLGFKPETVWDKKVLHSHLLDQSLNIFLPSWLCDSLFMFLQIATFSIHWWQFFNWEKITWRTDRMHYMGVETHFSTIKHLFLENRHFGEVVVTGLSIAIIFK